FRSGANTTVPSRRNTPTSPTPTTGSTRPTPKPPPANSIERHAAKQRKPESKKSRERGQPEGPPTSMPSRAVTHSGSGRAETRRRSAPRHPTGRSTRPQADNVPSPLEAPTVLSRAEPRP